MGYKFVRDKFSLAGLTPVPGELVEAERIQEFPLQMEARAVKIHPFASQDKKMAIPTVAVEVEILKVYCESSLLQDENQDRINPDAWHPLLMNFRQFYTTGERIHPSRLGEGSEERYAPWKSKGLPGIVKRKILNQSNRKYKV